MPEYDAKDVMEAVDTLRKTVEDHGTESSQYKEALEKTEKTLEAHDAKNQEIVAGLTAATKSQEDLKDYVEQLEKGMIEAQQAGATKSDLRESKEFKMLNQIIVKGEYPEDVKTMRMDDATQGGYLTTVEMDTEIIKAITEISAVRQVARVKTVGKKTLEMPTRTSIPQATYEGEAAAGDDDNSTYGSESMTAYRQTVTVGYTKDLLMDSVFDLVAEINGDVSESFAQGEGLNFVLGDGSKKPEGIITNPTLIADAFETAASGVLDFDDLRLVTGELKTGYNPMFAFNRRTRALLLTLKGTNGMYLWSPVSNDAPASINGDPYTIFPDLPDIAAGAFPVIYGDFMRGYRIIDRTGMTLIRDEVTQKKKNIIEITYHRYNTGQVVLAEALKLIEIKA